MYFVYRKLAAAVVARGCACVRCVGGGGGAMVV